LIDPFVAKAVRHYEEVDVTALALTNDGTDTQWFYQLARAAMALCLGEGRIRFMTPEGCPRGADAGADDFLPGELAWACSAGILGGLAIVCRGCVRRGAVFTPEAYGRGKMPDHSGWAGILPRNITPSDVDMVFAEIGCFLLVEFIFRSAEFERLSPGQDLLYKNFVRLGDGLDLAADDIEEANTRVFEEVHKPVRDEIAAIEAEQRHFCALCKALFKHEQTSQDGKPSAK
jgi:hypothetical protein